MKKSALVFIALFFLIFPTLILAQTTTTSSTEQVRSSATRTNTAAQKRIEEQRLKAQERVQTTKERVETKIASREARLQTRKENIATRTASLKAKLKTFKDQQKAKVAERVNENLNKVNESRTDTMLKHLEKMVEILSRLETRVNEAGQSGKDISSVTTTITDAQETIKTTKGAVETQSTKDYTIVATTEAKIRQDAQAARNNLHTDLKTVHNLVVAARKTVSDAISLAVSTLGGNK